jgi:ankyrin repeat protein
MLKELPETLDETYERILRDINKANRDHAHRLLQCLAVAVRPLHVAELAEVLAVDFGTAPREESSKLNLDWRWEDQEAAVLSTCSSLISVVDKYGFQIVQFSHFSVKEFLISSRVASSSADVSPFHILLEPAHTVLVKACLVVLLRLDELVDEDFVEDQFPLALYAAQHWVDHARFENVSSHIREGMEELFDPSKPYFASWLQIHDIDTWPVHDSLLYQFASLSHKTLNSAIPLYYAALCGFHGVAEQLIIKHPQQVHTTGGFFMSPLGAALRGGHPKIARLLYECGADVDVQGYNDYTPLHGASSCGHFRTVQWLLHHRANPNHRGKSDGWTSLHGAAYFGHVEVSRLLLRYKADNNAHDNKGQIPLHVAAQYGHVNVARLLLEHGADVNARDNNCNTPLHRAVKRGRLEVTRLFVEHGANIDAEDKKGRTAFQFALNAGYHDIAKLLSDHAFE